MPGRTASGAEETPMRKYRIGVDLGGTNIAAGIVDEEFSIVKKASVKTDVAGGAEKICGGGNTV